MLFGVLVIILAMLLVDPLVLINHIIVHWSWNLSLGVVIGTYANLTYVSSFPAGLWKVMARFPVGCSDMFALIYWFAWSKISFKLFIQYLLCWFLTCVYHNYWISIHWSWNVSSVCVRKFPIGCIQTGHTDFLPLQVYGRLWWGCRFFYFTCLHQYIHYPQGSSSIS